MKNCGSDFETKALGDVYGDSTSTSGSEALEEDGSRGSSAGTCRTGSI